MEFELLMSGQLCWAPTPTPRGSCRLCGGTSVLVGKRTRLQDLLAVEAKHPARFKQLSLTRIFIALP